MREELIISGQTKGRRVEEKGEKRKKRDMNGKISKQRT